jgi:hypothetical protein
VPQSLGKRPSVELERQVVVEICPMSIKLQIELLGEIVQVKDLHSYTGLSQVYPGQVFQAQGSSFTYDDLRGLGNGTHLVNANEKVKRDSAGRYERG